jgi:TIGR00255 family protein
MIKSMTGYGSASGCVDKLEITIELRSVNNRFLDYSVRIPRVYTYVEDAVKAEVQKVISRGKVDIYVSIDSSKADDVTISLNEPLAEAYLSALKKLGEKYGLENDMSVVSLSRLPDVLQIEKKETDLSAFSDGVRSILRDALKEFDNMRSREGEKLAEDMLSRLKEIERILTIIEDRSPKTVEEYRQRLYQRISEVLENREIDEGRILTEAAIFADRVAINEETVRLRSHISQMKDMLASEQPMGRKLDFIVQELNREVNTIGSKSNDTEMAHMVVDLKAEIEKIREQAQNIE